MRILIGRMRKANETQQFICALDALALRYFLEFKAELNVCARSTPRQQTGLLKDESAIPARPRHRTVIDKYRPGIQSDEPLNNSQQRRLSAAAFPYERYDFTLPNIKRNIAQDAEESILVLADTAKSKGLADRPNRKLGISRFHAQPLYRAMFLTVGIVRKGDPRRSMLRPRIERWPLAIDFTLASFVVRYCKRSVPYIQSWIRTSATPARFCGTVTVPGDIIMRQPLPVNSTTSRLGWPWK